MAATIQNQHPSAEVELVRGGGGDFIVTVDDGRELWNKNASGGGFPDPGELASAL